MTGVTPQTAYLARKLVPVDQAAEALRCSKRTIRRFIGRGEIVGYYIGSGRSMLRVDLDEVESLIRTVRTGTSR